MMTSPEASSISLSSNNTVSGESLSPPGSKTPESLTGCHSPGSPGSPIKDDACPICLGSINDKCASGSCLHYFCLVCLKEWSKQKAVCPLCKKSFTKILYEIKSDTDYKEWVVPKKITDQQSFASTITEFIRTTERSFFGYRTTNTGVRSHILNVFPRRRRMVPYFLNRGVLPFDPRENLESRRNQQRGSATFRLSIYVNNLWVQPLSDITGQYRESSPDLYREQPALTHRLVPWVNREVAALLSASRVSRVSVVLVEVMDLIERYPINSREFSRAMRPHFGSRTSHFVHEFYNFARSPYDMVGHDNAARYGSRFELDDDPVSDSEDDNEIIEVESNGDPIQPLDLSSRPAIEEVLANDGSVIISSGDSSSSDNDNNEYRHVFSETHNPEPPPEYNRYYRKNSAAKKSQSINDRGGNNISLDEPGPSGISGTSSGNVSVKKESAENLNSSDECFIVNVLKPKKDRTPEIINLSSDSDINGTKEYQVNKTHWKKKISSQVENKNSSKMVKKHKKQPRIDRSSFSLHFSGTVNCNHITPTENGREDHNYCGNASNQNCSETDGEEEFGSRVRVLKKPINRKRQRIPLTDSESDLEIRNKEKSVNSRLLIKGTNRAHSTDTDEDCNKKKKDKPSRNSKKVRRTEPKRYYRSCNETNMIDSDIEINLDVSSPDIFKNANNDEALEVRRSSRLVNKNFSWDNDYSSDEESISRSSPIKRKTAHSSKSNSKLEKSKFVKKDNKRKLTDSAKCKKSSSYRSRRHLSKQTNLSSKVEQLFALMNDSTSSHNSSRSSYISSEDLDSSSSNTSFSSGSSYSCSNAASLSRHTRIISKKRIISYSDSSFSDCPVLESRGTKASKKTKCKSKMKSKKAKEQKSKKKSKGNKIKSSSKSEKKKKH